MLTIYDDMAKLTKENKELKTCNELDQSTIYEL